MNAGKRSLQLDLNHALGREVVSATSCAGPTS